MTSQTRPSLSRPTLLYRSVAAGLLSFALALAPVVALPVAAHAVAPRVQRIPVTGVDPAAKAELGGGAGLASEADHRWPTIVALTPRSEVDPFDLVAVSWNDPDVDVTSTIITVRVRENRRWTDWVPLETIDEGPDGDSAEARDARGGSTPLLTSGADAVQVKVESAETVAPAGLQVELVDPGRSAADGTTTGNTPAATANAIGSAPKIITRAQWGADESLRTGSPSYTSDLRVGIVHHTASTNNYSADQAASQVRAMYAYHTRSLGWSDIGYNFLVDQYGRTYEGRYGGMARGVIGAHAGGYNANSFGVSVLGTYTSTEPPKAVITALTDVVAWKMATHAIDPYGSSQLTSAGGGTARYPEGDTRAFPNLMGHRDTGTTSCPGDALYSRLGFLRASVRAKIFETSSPGGSSAGDVLASGATLTEARYLRSRNGQHVLTANGYAGEHLGLVLTGSSCPAAVLNVVGRPAAGARHANVLAMQSDGNLVLYTNQRATWSSRTAGNPGAYVALQNDRNLVVYSTAGRPLFGTGIGCDTVRVGASGSGRLVPGATMTKNGYVLSMQADGNLVLYSPRRAIWSAGSAGNPGAALVVQNDGNLVVYSTGGRVLWASNSARGGTLLSTLALQPDGNLVLYTQAPGTAVGWASGTARVT